GSVRRPCSLSHMSVFVANSETECSRKNSREILRVVASSLMCLAPFSQYSFMCRLVGSGHAHPGQSIPFVWLMLNRLIAVRTSDVCSSEYSSACMTAGTPAADFLGGLTFGFSTPMCFSCLSGLRGPADFAVSPDHRVHTRKPSNRNT